MAGLHTYFFLATAGHGQPGDAGCFVTSAEWLDVNYGSIVRELLLDELGAEAVHVVAPAALPFQGTDHSCGGELPGGQQAGQCAVPTG